MRNFEGVVWRRDLSDPDCDKAKIKRLDFRWEDDEAIEGLERAIRRTP
jgi:hypothetical protein